MTPIVLSLMAFWCIDIAMSAALSGLTTISLAGYRSPADSYHISLIIALISNFWLVGLIIYNLVEKKFHTFS